MIREPRDGPKRYLDKAIVAMYNILGKPSKSNSAKTLRRSLRETKEALNQINRDNEDLREITETVGKQNEELHHQKSELEGRLTKDKRRREERIKELEKRLSQEKNLRSQREYLVKEGIRLRREQEGLFEEIKSLRINIALMRIRRGEDPGRFNCPEAMTELSNRYESLLENFATTAESNTLLRRSNERLTSKVYELVFDGLAHLEKLDKSFALMYLDSKGNVKRASERVPEYLSNGEHPRLCLSLAELLRSATPKHGKELIKHWKNGDERYHIVKLKNGKKLNIKMKRTYADTSNEVLLGTYVFLRDHKMRIFSREKEETQIEGMIDDRSNALDDYSTPPHIDQNLGFV